MKNKHLVLLFLSALAAGLLLREAPWRRAVFFKTKLLPADTAAIRQLLVLRPGRPELLFERADAQWFCTQDAKTVPVPSADVNALLHFISALSSIKIVKTERPDTLRVADNWVLSLVIRQKEAPDEVLYFGPDMVVEGQTATHLRLNRQRDVFLVSGSAAAVFPLSIEQYRHKAVLPGARDLGNLRELVIYHTDTLSLTDAADTTLTPEFQAALRQWEQTLQGLNRCAPADFFDENKAAERRFARIRFRSCCPDHSFDLQFFHQATPDFPDEPFFPERPGPGWPAYVMQSSYHPRAFFTLRDTAALFQLLNMLRPFVHEGRTRNPR